MTLVPIFVMMALLALVIAASGDVGGAVAMGMGLLLGLAAAWSGTRSGRRDLEAIQAYEERGVPLPRRITRKMDRWRRRHPGEHPPWEPPSNAV